VCAGRTIADSQQRQPVCCYAESQANLEGREHVAVAGWQGRQLGCRSAAVCAPSPRAHAPLPTRSGILSGVQSAPCSAGRRAAEVCRARVRGIPRVRPPRARLPARPVRSCHAEHLVAFSCKRRGFCPSCGARRMAKSAALLVDEVFPEQGGFLAQRADSKRVSPPSRAAISVNCCCRWPSKALQRKPGERMMGTTGAISLDT